MVSHHYSVTALCSLVCLYPLYQWPAFFLASKSWPARGRSHIYTLLQMYWYRKSNSIVFIIHWGHLSLKWKDVRLIVNNGECLLFVWTLGFLLWRLLLFLKWIDQHEDQIAVYGNKTSLLEAVQRRKIRQIVYREMHPIYKSLSALGGMSSWSPNVITQKHIQVLQQVLDLPTQTPGLNSYWAAVQLNTDS